MKNQDKKHEITKEKIQIRRYQDGDAKFISAIYYNTIHNINAADYTKEQIEAWAPRSSVDDCTGWQKKAERIKPYIALIQNLVVGFAECEPNGHIDCFYVHHKFQGHKVGSALMQAIETAASQIGLVRIYAEVSITAQPFFQKKGFSVVKKQTVAMRGVEMVNFIMEKHLAP